MGRGTDEPLTGSGRFSKAYRDSFANKIARHFDKYCEITNPVKFCPLEDIYRPAFSRKEWVALCRLLESNIGKQCLIRYSSFDLYLPGEPGASKYQRKHVCFGFPDGVERPNLDIEYANLEPAVQQKLDGWLKKAFSLKELRAELFKRCNRLLDFGWREKCRWTDNGWAGAPTPGQGCNTPAQVYRIWPELLPFLPPEAIAVVRNANAKSRLPKFISYYGTPEQFRCEAPLYRHGMFIDEDDDWEIKVSRYEEETDEDCLLSDEEQAFEKRKFDALTHILVQMSLMKDVPHVKAYPTIS